MVSQRMITQRTSMIAMAIVVCTNAANLHADWPQFRGPNSSGRADDQAPPVEFGPGKNERWRIAVPAGHSSPCIVGNAIFLTAFDKENRRLEILHINRDSGKIIWRRGIAVSQLETGHPSFNPASSTPTSDGQRVIAYFGSYGLICFGMDGTKLWEIKLPLARSYSGNATSPIIVGDKVILYRANYVDHFLLAVDKTTGKQIWKKPQRERFTTAMSAAATPIVVGDKLIVHAVQSVKAFSIADGNQLWQANCSTTATSTPVLAGDQVVIATWNQTGEPALTPIFPPFEKLIETNDKNKDILISPDEFPRKLMYFHRSEGVEAPQNGAPLRFSHVDSNRNGSVDPEEWRKLLDRTAERRKRHIPHGLVAIPINSKGNLDAKQIRFLERNGIPEVPSPLAYNGYIYFAKNGGILTAIDMKSGKRIYRTRTGGRGTHYASPILANNRLYITAGDGQISVVTTGPDPKILATNDMQQKTFATPAIVGGVIYVRTHDTLFAFESKK